MSVPSREFIKNLLASQLFTGEQVAELQRDLREMPRDQRPRTAEDLARVLVQRGWLTKFQAAAIYQGEIQWLVFGDYVVLDKIGAGHMGFVFKAQRRDTDDTVFALKVLPEQRIEQSTGALQRFQREIQLNLRLKHPNIVRMHDAGYDNEVPFLVMEYVDGGDLGVMAKSQRLEVDQAVNYVLQVARGLAYAHGKGIIHRDIKPSNLLLDPSGTVKILDLGLARLDDSVGGEEPDGRLTMDAHILGTPNYMAPEQARDARSADIRCDVYSLGCTWFCLLIGHAPYDRGNKVETLMAHMEDPIPSLCQERDDVPQEVDATFQKMMAKSPEDRFQTMHEVIAALERLLPSAEGPPSPPTETEDPPPPPEPPATFEEAVQPPPMPPQAPADEAVPLQQLWQDKAPFAIGFILGMIVGAVLAVVLMKVF